MSLRDELLNQQKEQAQKEKARKKEQQSEQEQSEQNFKMQRERLQKQAEAAYETLEKQVREGNIPEEWDSIYDKYVEKIKSHILAGNLTFSFKDTVTQKYYEEKASVCKGKNSAATLMSEYLTKRLKKDGFASAKFCLTDEVSYYATEWDIANQQAEQERKNAKAYEDYDRDWNNWYNNDTGGRAPSQSDYVPKQAKLKKTGEKHNYCFIVSGSMYRKSSGKVVDSHKDHKISGVISLVFGVLFAGFGFVFPFIFPPDKTLPVIGFGFGNPIASLVVFLIAGEILAVIVALIVNSFRHMRDAANKKKRIVSLAVVCVFLVCCITGGVMFATMFPFSKITLNGVTYQKTEDGKNYEIAAFEQDATEAVVVDSVRGLTVIPTNWSQFPQIKTVVFRGNSLKNFFQNKMTPEKVVVDGQMTEIESSTFEDCAALVEVVLPASVTKIGYSAFRNCSSLTKINLGDNISYVDEYAFAGCAAMEEAYFGHSFQTVHNTSFSGWSGLKKITVNCNNVPSNDNPSLAGLRHIFDTRPTNEVELVIGKDVVVANFFYLFDVEYDKNTNNITTVTFADGCQVKELSGTFQGFVNLKSIVLPDSVEKVGNRTFAKCRSIEAVDLSQVTELETGELFFECTSLREVILPENAFTEMQAQMFGECKALKSLTIPQSVTVIGANAFDGSGLEEVVLPENLKELGRCAFRRCYNLILTIPQSVTLMGDYVFESSTGNVFCEAESAPEGWHENWFADTSCSVVWGYKG